MNSAAGNLLSVTSDVAGIRRRTKIVLTFLAGQGSTQALNLIAGFLVLRWLDVDSYAKYGLTYGFQSTASVLIDLGFSATIVAMIGPRVEDRRVIGNYVRAARQLRLRMITVVMPVTAVVYALMTHRLQWSAASQLSLFLSILVTIYFSGLQAYYGAAFIVSRRLAAYYRILVVAALSRVAGCTALHFAGRLDAASAVWINAAGVVGTGIACQVLSRGLIEEPRRSSPPIVRQMIRYVTPNIPGVIFYAVQAQLALFLIASLGPNKGVAQVAALSRIGQLLVFLYALNGMVIEPWFARSPKEKVLPRYFLTAALAFCFSISFVGVSVARPAWLLWIFGKNYQNLDVELAWMVVSVCLSYLASLTWTVITARRLIYWSTTFINIGLILVTEVAFAALIGTATTLRAIQFGCAGALASLVAQCINLAHGTSRGPRVGLVAEETDGGLSLVADALVS